MPLLTSKNIFRLSREDLTLFFSKKNIATPDNYGECRISLNILKDCGYNHGLCLLLNTDKDTGIIGDPEDLERRLCLFGKNIVALPSTEKFHVLLARQFEDENFVILMWAAFIYFMFSLFSENTGSAYVESLTIYSGLMLAALITSSCDFLKEAQFQTLKD